nr:serine/arginine repetitive matrix protein 1-like [Aegilops tauschii subsp. strangulata]
MELHGNAFKKRSDTMAPPRSTSSFDGRTTTTTRRQDPAAKGSGPPPRHPPSPSNEADPWHHTKPPLKEQQSPRTPSGQIRRLRRAQHAHAHAAPLPSAPTGLHHAEQATSRPQVCAKYRAGLAGPSTRRHTPSREDKCGHATTGRRAENCTPSRPVRRRRVAILSRGTSPPPRTCSSRPKPPRPDQPATRGGPPQQPPAAPDLGSGPRPAPSTLQRQGS